MNSVRDATSAAAEGMGNPRNSLLPPVVGHGREAVVARQTERAANQIDRSDEPAKLGVSWRKHVFEHDAMHQERRRGAEGNQVRQRIKFAAERAFRAAHARHPAVEQIEDAGQQDEAERHLDLAKIVGSRGVGLHDLRQRHKAAEEVARRQQVGQEDRSSACLPPDRLADWPAQVSP